MRLPAISLEQLAPLPEVYRAVIPPVLRGPERPHERALVPGPLRRGGGRGVPDARAHRGLFRGDRAWAASISSIPTSGLPGCTSGTLWSSSHYEEAQQCVTRKPSSCTLPQKLQYHARHSWVTCFNRPGITTRRPSGSRRRLTPTPQTRATSSTLGGVHAWQGALLQHRGSISARSNFNLRLCRLASFY